METSGEYKFAWMDEKVKKMPVKNWLYIFICFISFRLRRKFTFKEMFLIIRNLNSRYGEHNSFNIAMYKILEIYKYQYNKYPDGIKKKEHGT